MELYRQKFVCVKIIMNVCEGGAQRVGYTNLQTFLLMKEWR
jgi:hypothetical protein